MKGVEGVASKDGMSGSGLTAGLSTATSIAWLSSEVAEDVVGELGGEGHVPSPTSSKEVLGFRRELCSF